MMEGMDDGHPTFDGPDEDAADWAAWVPFGPTYRRHDCDSDDCTIGRESGECVLVGSLVGVSPLRGE